jgi:hypothetical protein
MNTERNGGPGDGAADGLQDRLARRFDSELAQAERDYPSLRVAHRTGSPDDGRRRSGWSWPRLASGVVAVAVLAVVGLVGLGLASKPAQVAGPALAAGIPTEIDGQKVYLVSDDVLGLTGSILLAGYVGGDGTALPTGCAAGSADSRAQLDLAPSCGLLLFQDRLDFPNRPDGYIQGWALAPKSAAIYSPWQGAAVVVRGHFHDSEAAQCPGDSRDLCEKSLVVEAVVWPDVPAQLNGEKVYRAADQASFPASGSFLLGGRVNKPDLVPPCPMPLNKTQAEQQLVPYCFVVSIDGLGIAPKSEFNEPKNEIVIARVHVNDTQAAECPATALAQCKSSIVVESVVWRSDVLITANPSGTPGASASPLLPNGSPGGVAVPSASSEAVGTGSGVGPTSLPSAVPIGKDGVPTSYGPQVVYRVANLPTDTSFLLGGVLGRDTSCAAPTGMSAKPPACGYWTVDGVAVGNLVPIPDSLVGAVVVVHIDRSKALGTCTNGPCRTTDLLVVTEIVWSEPVLATPPPPVALPSR